MMATASPPAARDVCRPSAWTLAALAPALGLEAFARGGVWLAIMSVTIALCIAVAALAGRTGRSMPTRLLTDLDVAVVAALVFVMLPGDANPWIACAATALSVLLARNLFGGLGQTVFHPAMLALAMMGLQATDSPAPLLFSEWTFLACWLGGGVLLARGVISWRTPLAFLSGALAIAIVSPPAGPGFAGVSGLLAEPAIVICAFFVAGDTVTGCLQPRARLANGFLGGALVVLFIHWQPAKGLPLAMLLVNFIAPWLDQALATPRRKALAR